MRQVLGSSYLLAPNAFSNEFNFLYTNDRIFNKLCRSMLQARREQSDDDEESVADPLPPVTMDS